MMITRTMCMVLDTMEAMEIDVRYDCERGEYVFSYLTEDMALVPSDEEGGVCFAAEFTYLPYLEPVLDMWTEFINNDEEGFVVKEDRPGVGRVYKEWLVDWDEPVSEGDVKDMLDVMANACHTIDYNLSGLNLPPQ